MPLKYLKNIEPRAYQISIFETCKEKNCLVVLPTGIGKTLISLMLTIDRLTKFPTQKVVFLAPTKPLAEQHINYFKKHLPELFADMQLFTGLVKAEKRKKIWQTADIIFSTPQCLENDIKNNLYNLENTNLLIIDECHRCLKNYAYTYVAKKYIEQAIHPRILGLTASPGHDASKIKQICKNLNIQEVELRTRESPDVKKYLQELKFQKIIIDFPAQFQEIRELLKIIYDKKIKELKNRKLLHVIATKKNLLELQSKIMKQIATGNRHYNILSGASACAQAIKIHYALELLETQTLHSLKNYFISLFEQAKTQKTKATQQLIKQKEFNKAYILVNELLAKKIENPKLNKLKNIIENELKQNPKMKAIVFAQYRDTLVRICKELNSLAGINARVFVGQAIKNNGKEKTGLSQKEQQELLREFAFGETNLLCSSSIGEEGLDIVETSIVIFYEPIPSEIRSLQRAGRTARLMKGKLIILITKGTRDEAYYYVSRAREKKMHKAIDTIKKDFANKGNKKEKSEIQKSL